MRVSTRCESLCGLPHGKHAQAVRFYLFFLPRKQLCCDFTGGHRNSPNSGTLLSAAQTFPLSGESPAPTKVVKTNIKVFARLFQKAAQSKGSAFGRPAHRAKFFLDMKRRRGDKTVRRTVLPWGTLAGGSPVPTGTPNSSREFARALLISPDISFINAFCEPGLPCFCDDSQFDLPKNKKSPFPLSRGKGVFFCFIPEYRGFSAVCRNRPANLRRSECSRAWCLP